VSFRPYLIISIILTVPQSFPNWVRVESAAPVRLSTGPSGVTIETLRYQGKGAELLLDREEGPVIQYYCIPASFECHPPLKRMLGMLGDDVGVQR